MDRQRYDSVVDGEIASVSGVDVADLGRIQVDVIKGDFDALPYNVQCFIAENVKLCQPRGIYLCDGSQEEAEEMTEKLVASGMLTKLDKLDNCVILQVQMKNEEYR